MLAGCIGAIAAQPVTAIMASVAAVAGALNINRLYRRLHSCGQRDTACCGAANWIDAISEHELRSSACRRSNSLTTDLPRQPWRYERRHIGRCRMPPRWRRHPETMALVIRRGDTRRWPRGSRQRAANITCIRSCRLRL